MFDHALCLHADAAVRAADWRWFAPAVTAFPVASECERGCLLPVAALAPKALPQYEIDVVARNSHVPQFAVRQLCQCAALPGALGRNPPSAELPLQRQLPQALEGVAEGGRQIFGEVGKSLCRK